MNLLSAMAASMLNQDQQSIEPIFWKVAYAVLAVMTGWYMLCLGLSLHVMILLLILIIHLFKLKPFEGQLHQQILSHYINSFTLSKHLK